MKNAYFFQRLALRRTKSFLTFFRLMPVMMLALLLMGSGVKAWGQTTIAFNGAESTGTTLATSSNDFTNSNTATGTPAERIKSGTNSYQQQETGTKTLITNVTSLSGYASNFVEIWNAMVSTTTGNGIDATVDKMEVYVSQTSTFSTTPDVTINASVANVRWGMSGTGVITTTAGSPVTQTYSTSGNRTGPNAYSKIIINLPADWTNVYIKIVTVNDATQEVWCIDDIAVKGTSTVVPDIALDNNGTQVAAADVSQGTAAVVLHKFQLGATSASASITGMTCTTTGTYAAADITNLKVRYSADATLDGADATLSTFTNPGAAGSKTFPSFTNRSIAKDATGYFFVTADIAANATHNNTIAVDAITTDNLTFSSGNKTGSTTAGGAQTFKDVTVPTVTTYSPADGNTAVTVNQNLVLTFSENIAKGTGNITIKKITGDAVVQTIDIASASVTISGTTLTIDPPADLLLGTQYYVNIDATAIKDNAGNGYAGIANNTTWNFTTVAPSVTNVTSSNGDGTYKVGDVITVTVTFNENVVVTGTPYVLLKMVGTNRQAAYASGTGTNTLTFSYTLQTSDEATDLDYVASTSLSGGTITSADGVTVTRTLASPGTAGSLGYNKAIVVDCVKPTVSTYNPTDGNTAVTINQNLVLTFNENVKRGASGSIVIYTTGPTVFETIPYDDSRITFATNTVTINPEGTFAYSSDYYIQTTGNPISDMYDNNYAGISNATTWNFTTECGPVTLPFSQDFTTYLPNTCWTEKTGLLAAPSTLTEANSAWTADGFANNGTTGSARLNIYGTTAKEWLITPIIDLGTTTDYQLEFDLALTDYGNANAITTDVNGTTGTDDKFAVVISTDNGETWTSANTLRIWDNSGSSDVYNNLTPAGTHVTISLADYTGWVKIGFYGESTVANADNDLFIDNLSVVQLATCITPTVVSSSDLTAISATISWVASSSNPANGYQYEVRTSGAAGSGATGLVTSGTTTAGVVSKAITGLTPNTAYNIFVRSDCGAGDYSAWTTMYSFNTPNLAAPTATAATAISTTGFTANWGAVASATGYELDVYTKEGVATNTTSILNNPGTNNVNGTATQIGVDGWTYTNISSTASYIKMVKNGTGDAPSIISPTMNLTNYATLTYDMTGGTFGGTDATANALNLYVSTNNGDTWSSAIAITVSGNSESGDVADVDLSAYVGNSHVKIKLEATGATTGIGVRAKNITLTGKQYNITSIPGSPFTVTETTKAVTGLTANSAYYYAVVAKNGSTASASSNVITAFTAIDGAVNASAMPDCPTCDVVIADGGFLTVDANKTYNTITLQPTAKLMLNDTKTLSATTITIQSDANGTGTIVGNVSGAATVNQYLPGYRTWYLSSPVASATPSGMDRIKYYDETKAEASESWVATTTMTKGKGYLVVPLSGNNILFSGTLNNGNVNIDVTRSVDNGSKPGFNLVGNPYPSYLEWSKVNDANSSLMPSSTMWYRTKKLNQSSELVYQFWTVNGDGVGSPNGASQYIPPMQAFWVRAKSSGQLQLTNDMRSHAPATDYLLKAPAVNSRTLIRLELSNGTNTDEAVLYLSENANNALDALDAPKMSIEDASIAEIFTRAGNEKLVINALQSLPKDTEIALGFEAGSATTFNLRVNELSNLPSDVKLILKDNVTKAETDLTDGTAVYSFNNIATSGDRFSIIFRTKGAVTGIDQPTFSGLSAYSNANNQLTVLYDGAIDAHTVVSVYNAVGQRLVTQSLKGVSTVIDGEFAPGVYVVKVNNLSRKLTIKN